MRAVTVSLPGLSIHSPHGSFLMNTDPRESPALVLMTRGAGWFSPPKALARKRSAAAASRLADRRKSIVAPLESTAGINRPSCP